MTLSSSGFMWECSCSNVQYSEEEPEECESCGKVNNFIKMPEEIAEERQKEMLEEPKLKTVKKAKTSRRKK